jgi:hypothetical protein
MKSCRLGRVHSRLDVHASTHVDVDVDLDIDV